MKLKINHVSKNFKDIKALDDISCEFETGKIYALLGRNGAGKSTLMNIIANRLFPDTGEITIDGNDIYNKDEELSKLFLMSDADFFGSNKVKDVFSFVRYFDPAFDLDYAKELVEAFELNIKMNVSKLSTGYSSIFKIILALCSSANFVMFDEPILGLDATHRDLFYKILLNRFLQKEGKVCYILSTHLIEEIDSIAERAVVIKKGKLFMEGEVEELISSVKSVSGSKVEVEKAIQKANKVFGIDKIGNLHTAYISGDIDQEADVTVEKVDLQRMFIEITRENK